MPCGAGSRPARTESLHGRPGTCLTLKNDFPRSRNSVPCSRSRPRRRLRVRHSAPLFPSLCATRDAALAETIVFGCLRYQAQLDFLIGHFSGRPQSKLDMEVRIALRMGIYQIRYLDRIPAHAAVQESVELVKRAHKRSATGFVNAVLRKVNRKPITGPIAPPSLACRTGCWLAGTRTTDWKPQPRSREPRSKNRKSLVNPETGRQQDIGAQSIVPFLQIEPGMTALDLCAAPGNKTAQMLQAGASVVACDRSLAGWRTSRRSAQVVLDATATLPFRREIRPDPGGRPLLRHRHARAKPRDQVANDRRRRSALSRLQRKILRTPCNI